MKKLTDKVSTYRIGNDIKVCWRIKEKGGAPYNLEERELLLYMQTGSKTIPVDLTLPSSSIVGNCVSFVFFGKEQQLLGEYMVVLVENSGTEGMRTVDKERAFRLVPRSSQADSSGSCCPCITTESLELTSVIDSGVKGDTGKSAYEVAVDNGFDGTVEEWLESLNGADGAPGPQGIPGERGEKGAPGPQGEDGATPVITATATVTDEGAPGVDVSKSGTDKAPVFSFAFRGITAIYEPVKALISRSREAYIDTGIAPLNGLWRFEIEGNTKSNEAAVLADLYVDNSHRMGGVIYNRANPKYDCWWLGVGYSSNPINIDLAQPFTLEQSRSGVKIKQNGRTITISYAGDETTTVSDDATFRLLSSARADIQPTYSVIYSAKFFEEDASAPAAWFLPVRRRTDGMLGMLDAISGKFFFSAGSKNFEAIEMEEDQITLYTNLLRQI